MNLLTLRAQTRRKTRTISTAALANSAIDEQLNQGYKIFCTKLASINEDFFEEQNVAFNLKQNSGLYSLPTDCLKFKQLRLAYSTPSSDSDYKIAVPYDPAQISSVQAEEVDIATSNPIVDITNNYFRIWPKPTSAVSNGGRTFYIARPSALSLTSDSPVFPVDYHDLLSAYAAKEICGWHGSWNKYKVYKQEWDEGIAKALTDLTPRNINVPERFKNILEKARITPTTELWD